MAAHNRPLNISTTSIAARKYVGTSYLPQFQKRAVTNLKNYSTKNNENLRKPKAW